MRIIALILATVLDLQSALAVECPVNRTTYRDTNSGSVFVAERVAVTYRYRCEDRAGEVRSLVPRPDLAECRGPYGQQVIQGTVRGEPVYAVYTTSPAVPCCAWASYAEMPGWQPTRWLSPDEAPVVRLLSPFDTIEEPRATSNASLAGPLAGGQYIPVSCRREGAR